MFRGISVLAVDPYDAGGGSLPKDKNRTSTLVQEREPYRSTLTPLKALAKGNSCTRVPVGFAHAFATAGAIRGRPARLPPLGAQRKAQVDFDGRHLSDAKLPVVVEIRLHNAAILKVDRIEEGR